MKYYRPNYNFDPVATKEKLIAWIRDWFDENGPGCNAVLGISGGKDSTIAAALCVEALGKDRVIGVLMPNGEQHDIKDSYKVVNHLGIKYIEVNIEKAVFGVQSAMLDAMQLGKSNIQFMPTNQTEFNLPPRIRMTTLYAVSQSNNGRVVNTCNLSETMIGWETRWGDAVGDFSPFANLTATEVVAIGNTMDIPKELVNKVPADGLCGSTDEDAFGFTYAVLDRYLRTGEIEKQEDKEKIDRKIKNNWFKHSPIPAFELD